FVRMELLPYLMDGRCDSSFLSGRNRYQEIGIGRLFIYHNDRQRYRVVQGSGMEIFDDPYRNDIQILDRMSQFGDIKHGCRTFCAPGPCVPHCVQSAFLPARDTCLYIPAAIPLPSVAQAALPHCEPPRRRTSSIPCEPVHLCFFSTTPGVSHVFSRRTRTDR